MCRFVVDDLDVDGQSNAYLSGNIGGSVIQASEGAFQSAYTPFERPSSIVGIDSDGVVAKITSAGQIAGATYFGPSALNIIAAAQDGSVAVSGFTYAPGFLGITAPSTSGNFYFAANVFPAVPSKIRRATRRTQSSPGKKSPCRATDSDQ